MPTYAVTNPSDEPVVATIEELEAHAVDAAISRAAELKNVFIATGA